MRREYTRLVRDKVPDIITHSGRRCEYRILSESEVILALQDKLIEKADKFSKRPSEEEVSDIFELLDAIISKFGYEQMHIDYLKLKNREEKGGYDGNTYLVYIEDDTEAK